jgi:hypothetical protein
MEYPSLDKPKAGAIRFNTDSSQMEIYNGFEWTGISATSPELQTGGTRGLFHGFFNDSATQRPVDYVQISTTGNAIDFGDLNDNQFYGGATSSRTLSYYMGGQNMGGSHSNTIQQHEFASTGNFNDFGNLANAVTYSNSGASNGTRGLSAGGGYTGGANTNVIEYFALQPTGDGLDFGDLTAALNPLVPFEAPEFEYVTAFAKLPKSLKFPVLANSCC